MRLHWPGYLVSLSSSRNQGTQMKEEVCLRVGCWKSEIWNIFIKPTLEGWRTSKQLEAKTPGLCPWAVRCISHTKNQPESESLPRAESAGTHATTRGGLGSPSSASPVFALSFQVRDFGECLWALNSTEY